MSSYEDETGVKLIIIIIIIIITVSQIHLVPNSIFFGNYN